MAVRNPTVPVPAETGVMRRAAGAGARRLVNFSGLSSANLERVAGLQATERAAVRPRLQRHDLRTESLADRLRSATICTGSNRTANVAFVGFTFRWLIQNLRVRLEEIRNFIENCAFVLSPAEYKGQVNSTAAISQW